MVGRDVRMKTFSQFLIEMASPSKFSDVILYYEYAPLVLRSTVWSKLFPDEVMTEAWHVTDSSGFDYLARNKGRKTSISTFTKAQLSLDVLRGVATRGGVVLKVKGKVAANFSFDLYTQPSNKGYRFITMGHFTFKRDLEKFYKKNPEHIRVWYDMIEYFKNIIPEWAKKNGVYDDIDYIAEWDGKTKYEVIKHYLDTTEAYVTKNAKKIREAFLAADDNPDRKWNEIVMDYPEILYGYINDETENIDKILKTANEFGIEMETDTLSNIKNKVKRDLTKTKGILGSGYL